ncbi:uncharacterized protein C8A04DRAFT_35404 [Dichotomopilus funicola]|uniref:Uncharacterized protein n=1 Tax=Dichotomopilus funicola TaxID=1934379 RepID=A0AAN6V6J7_9PEZI|nr:hypothetical protein C8A04DRAFT_35404 [Dichotomopilus funicola]
MASATIATVSRSSLNNPTDEPAKITSFKHIASYSWHNETAPTISVPAQPLQVRSTPFPLLTAPQGSPPLWSPPTTTFSRVDPDSGTVYIDQNAARSPSSPLEPLFRAALAENPDFSLRNIDLVTDRGNLRKLLRFVQASSNEVFRIFVEVVGGDGDMDGDSNATALFTRRETQTVETIRGFRGYGRNFEKVYTKQPAGQSGHHRIVGYNFGGMRCVVRYETDAYVGSDAGLDTLVDDLGALSLSETERRSSGLTVVRSSTTGKQPEIPASSILEIKTRAASRVLDMAEVLPQLWASQTPKLAVGYYSSDGAFKNVEVRDMTSEISFWEAASREDLKRLVGLLGDIIRAVRGLSGCRAVVEYTGGSDLRVVAAGEGQKPALPDDLYAKWKVSPTAGALETTTTRDVEKRAKESEETSPRLIPVGTPLASDMEYAIRKGPRQFFCRLPGTLFHYHHLCLCLRSLSPEAVSKVLGRINFTYKDIMADFRRGKSDYDDDERRHIPGAKTVARDAAFRLVYMFLSDDARAQDRNAAYNAAFFVVSHREIFGARTRGIVREVYEDKFSVTDKQRAVLDKWSKAEISDDIDKGESETTEPEERGYLYDSDDSDFW